MKPGNDLLPLARDLIAQGRLAQASHCLQALLRLQPTHLEAHNLLETHRLDGNFTDAFGIESRISPDDDIFRFFANHPSCTNPIRDYLSDGWRTMVELGRLLESLDRPLGRCGSFLEFASGCLNRKLLGNEIIATVAIRNIYDFASHTLLIHIGE